MSTLTVTLPDGVTAVDGKQITFMAPVDSYGVTGITIGSDTYTLLDSNNNAITSSTFKAGAYVTVNLDVQNKKAFMLNAASDGFKKVELTSAEYAALETKDANTMYVLTDVDSNDVFVATYGTTTSAEIEAAYQAGKPLFCYKGKRLYTLYVRDSETTFRFTAFEGDVNRLLTCTDSIWTDAATGIATKGYLSTELTGYVAKTGGTMTGTLTLSGDPTADLHAATKQYVDAAKPKMVAITLTAAGWDATSKAQTATVTGVLADETKQVIIPSPAKASMAAYYEAGIICTGQAANSLTFTCETVPTAALTVYVAIQGVG